MSETKGSGEAAQELEGILQEMGKNPNCSKLLTFLNEQVLREQQIFWQRFAALATLQAGLLVVSTSISVENNPKYIIFIGEALALAWFYIQLVSLWYVNRSKRLYHEMLRRLNIKWDEPHKYLRFLSKKKLSSTDIGMWIPLVVFLAWVILWGYLTWGK